MPRSRVGAGLLVAVLLVVASFASAQVATGLGGRTVALWIAVVGAAVVLPGFSVARVVRGHPAGVLDDLAWALPIGSLLTLGGWAAGRLVGGPVSPMWQAAVVLGVIVAVPSLRRRLLRTDTGATWGWGSGAVVTGSLLVTVLWSATTALAALPVSPGVKGFRYSPDSMFHVAMTGELARTAVPTYPMVAGEPMSYHWFFYAVSAQLGQGLDTVAVVTRLMPVTLLLGLVLIVASVARDVSGRASGAAIGALLVGVLGNTLPAGWVIGTGIPGRFDADGAALDPVRLYWQHSPTQAMGWVAAVACFGATVRLLRHGLRADPANAVVLLGMGLLAAGSKSSVPPVLLCGVLAAGAVSLVRREWPGVMRAVVASTGVAGTWVFAMLVVYPGGSYGLRVIPGDRAALLAGVLTPALVTHPTQFTSSAALTTSSVAVVVWLTPLLPRLVGLGWQLRWRPRDPAGWVGTGTVVGGLAGTFLTRHPGQSEVFFLVSAYPVGLVVSAAGLVLLLDRVHERLGRRVTVVVLVTPAVAGVLVTAAVARWAGDIPPVAIWRAAARSGQRPGAWLSPTRQLLAWVAPDLVLASASLVIALLAVVGVRAVFSRTGFGLGQGAAVVATVVLLGGGAVSTWEASTNGDGQSVAARLAANRQAARAGRLTTTTSSLVAAAHLIREHSGPQDVVATNRICAQLGTAITASRPCDPRDFTVAALTGRRTDVSGWAYASRSVAAAWTVPGGYAAMPFWDPARLSATRTLVTDPTSALARAAWERGVRWVLADRSAGPVSDHLDEIGQVMYSSGGVEVVRLDPQPPTP